MTMHAIIDSSFPLWSIEGNDRNTRNSREIRIIGLMETLRVLRWQGTFPCPLHLHGEDVTADTLHPRAG